MTISIDTPTPAVPSATLAAYTTPQPRAHLCVHHLNVDMLAPPAPRSPLPQLALVLPGGEAHVLLDALAWDLNPEHPGVAELEAGARAWAAELPTHQRALAELWVRGRPMAPVPCLRWPLLRAFLLAWQGGGAPGSAQRRLLAALAEDGEQVDALADAGAAARPGRPEKVSAEKVREVYRLKVQQGQSWMETASATQLGVSTCREIAAGRYAFTSPSAKDAWGETFGAKKPPC